MEQADEAVGVIMPMLRATEELIATEQYRDVLAAMPPVVVRKIGDSAPEPLALGAVTPLDGIRVVGRAYVIAGAGTAEQLCGRSFPIR
ncbi:hypothetical protein ACFYZB_41630 [Streptomyces sp. NPDC001852]|uniref:hypothetical protein n=1 Tax=unclassified Streptomyces TaxID=2593676 RepID=UPI00332B626F